MKICKHSILCCIILTLFTLFFNLYYFFIKRDVGPSYYISKYFDSPDDPILELLVYQDLRKQYLILNNRLREKKVFVFLGDSITKGFSVDEYFSELHVLNRGISHDTTLGVINRLNQNINNLNIEKLFLMIGYNDLRYRTNSEILKNIASMLSKISAEKIYVQSILPVESNRKGLNPRILQLNKDIRELCVDENCIYIDLYSHFFDDTNGLSNKYSRDGIHLNALGYELWYKKVKQFLE